MARIVTTIVKTGPFFAHDPALTLRQNADRMMEAIAREGEADVRAQVAAGVRTPSEHFLPGVVGRTHRLDGTPFKIPGAVVSQTHVYPWRSAGSRKYRGGKLEARIHAFRRTRSRVSAVRRLNTAELLKGIA
jgi:hypothetical protein